MIKQMLVSVLNIVGSVFFLFMLAMIGLLLTMVAVMSQIRIPASH
jgi:hypothetical protein